MTWQYDIEWHNGGGNRKDRHRTSDLSTSTLQGRKTTNSDITSSSLYERDSRMKNIVVVTSKPRSQTAGNLITTHTWTSLIEKEDTKQQSKQQLPTNSKNKNITYSHKSLNTTIIYDDENKMRPLAIYVQVLRGSSPILKARVMMTTIVEQANGSKTRFAAIELKDNGYGGKSTLKLNSINI